MPGTLRPAAPQAPEGGASVEESDTVPRHADDTEPAMPPSAANPGAGEKEKDEPEEDKEAEEDPRALIGSVISGRYRVDELIGKGGMGAVYRGEQVHLHKQVAIKVLRAHVQKMPQIVARFEREAVAGAHIQHPNVVSATDFGQLEDGSYFLILEYVDAVSLKEVMADGPLPVDRALHIARQIAAALEAVHDKGIVHRDVKPQNVLVDPSDQIKIIDFGLAKVSVEHLAKKGGAPGKKPTVLTLAGTIFGTFAYLAPEAGMGMEAIDARADLYALGIILYEMLCSKHPFEARDRLALFKKQQLDDPPPLHVRAPEIDVPPAVEAVVMRLIQRDRTARYASAHEVIAAIDDATAALSRPPVRPEPEPPPPAPRPLALSVAEGARSTKRRPRAVRPWMLAVTTAAALGIGAIVVIALRLLFPPAKPLPPPISVTVPSAVPTESAAPPPPASGTSDAAGLDAEALRGRLKKAVGAKDWAAGEKVIMALARVSPKALSSEGTRADVVAVAAGVSFDEGSAAADELFELLTHGLGSDGLDILFDLARGRGGTRGGKRAMEVLSRPEVIANETPALRVTLEFLKGSCEAKRALAGRAAAEGDQRTLGEMQQARAAKCANKKDPCCFREDKAMADAVTKLKGRLGM